MSAKSLALIAVSCLRRRRSDGIRLAPQTAISVVPAPVAERAYERGVVGAHQLPLVLKEWRQPRFEEFKARTAWSLFNAVTTVLGGQQRHIKQPQAFVAQTMQLHHLLEFKRGETDVPHAQTAS